MVIRYLSVFHANLLSNEIRVMMITRLFVLCTAPTLALIGGYENTDIYVLITKVRSIHLCKVRFETTGFLLLEVHTRGKY